MTWNIDYRFNARNQKTYFVQVFVNVPQPIESRSFASWSEAFNAAVTVGLFPNNRI